MTIRSVRGVCLLLRREEVNSEREEEEKKRREEEKRRREEEKRQEEKNFIRPTIITNDRRCRQCMCIRKKISSVQ